jgi:hypothetical protein
MLQLIISLLTDARTNVEIDEVIKGYQNTFMDNPELYIYVTNARNRINTIRKECYKSWKISELN